MHLAGKAGALLPEKEAVNVGRKTAGGSLLQSFRHDGPPGGVRYSTFLPPPTLPSTRSFWRHCRLLEASPSIRDAASRTPCRRPTQRLTEHGHTRGSFEVPTRPLVPSRTRRDVTAPGVLPWISPENDFPITLFGVPSSPNCPDPISFADLQRYAGWNCAPGQRH